MQRITNEEFEKNKVTMFKQIKIKGLSLKYIL